MPERVARCGKCGGAMEAGHLPGVPYSGIAATACSVAWVPGRGQATPSFALKKSAKKPRRMTAWRCTDCGFVEFYAH